MGGAIMGIAEARAFQAWVNSCQQAVNGAEQALRASPPPTLSRDRRFYSAAANRRAYARLGARSGRVIVRRTHNLAALNRIRQPIVSARNEADNIRSLAIGLRPITQMNGFAELRALVMQDLASNPRMSGIDIDEILTDMAPRRIFSKANGVLDMASAAIEAHAVSQLASINGALWATVVSSLWRSARNPSPVDIDEILTVASTTLEKGWEDLRQAFKSDRLNVVTFAALALRRTAARQLVGPIPRAAGAIAAGQSPAETVAISIGECARELFTAFAAGSLIAWETGWGRNWPRMASWCDTARNTRSASMPFKRKPVLTTNQLSSRRDGSIVTVNGSIVSLTITHRGRKAISIATLQDDQGLVELVVPYIKMDSGGMVPGCFARAVGIWRRANPETGRPGLLVDRLAASEARGLAQAARFLIADVASPWPHNLNLAWSLKPGSNGAVNLLRHGTWHDSGRQ